MIISLEKTLKILSDPTRLEIIHLLLEGETCSCTLVKRLPISQPTLSHHLKTLTKAGITRSHRDGNWIKYYVNRDVLLSMSRFFNSLAETENRQCSI
jgi:ArsR family transcriptional regulator